MKAIVGNKIFDTETSEKITTQKSHGEDLGGETWDKTIILYKSRIGNYFFLDNDSDKYPNPRIIPISPEEVLKWLTKHQDIDIILKHFPDQIEKG